MMTKTQQAFADAGGIQRIQNLVVRHKDKKFLANPPLYMKLHKNVEEQEKLNKNKFKPKKMVGDIHKPNCEFTSDLTSMAHKTKLAVKNKAKFGCTPSNSLR